MKKSLIALAGLAGLVIFSATPAAIADKRVAFGGGPAGGTFQVVANAVQTYDPVKALKGYNVKAQATAGSIENLRLVNKGRLQFGVAYSGHVWLGREGKLKNDTTKYKNVMAVSFLYGAPAQLVVKKGSGIKSVKDLIGKNVGVGNAGSGAFANAELFFSHMNVWDKMKRNAMGYNDAAQAFGNNQLDAIWLFTGFPSGAVILAAQTNDIELIDLGAEARNSKFLETYPYFSTLSVPAGTYKGVDKDTPSFQDSTLWIANADTPAELVYDLLKLIYADAGIKHMHAAKSTFKNMKVATGTDGIVTPFHPGAIKFWKEMGKL